jgi:CubicO group peptidase (beta-lactamase class C family)
MLFAQWALQQKGGKDTSGRKVFRFSNANTIMAVVMLEKASGKPWEELLKEYVNKPLGIDVKTGWPNSLSPNEPWGHWVEGGGRYIAIDPKYWFHISLATAVRNDALYLS